MLYSSMAERPTVNRMVAGSSPARAALGVVLIKRIARCH